MSRMIGRRLLAAEAAQPVAHVGDEALASLLAVVADVDAGGELLRDGVAGRRLDRRRQRAGVDRLAASGARPAARPAPAAAAGCRRAW